MESDNQKIEVKPNSGNSKAKNVLNIVASNPNMIFDIGRMTELYNRIHKDNALNSTISTIMARLYAKNKLIRTPTQLSSGYFYSVHNNEKLKEIYNDYLVPPELENKDEIRQMILKDGFEDLKTNQTLDLGAIKEFDFVKKYGLSYFYNARILNFLVTDIGFLMCDGHVRKTLQQIEYDFNKEEDAIEFKSCFNSIFYQEYISLKYNQFCFRIIFCNKSFAKLITYLGVPSGNKVFASFSVPNWIYNGSDDIKKTFLSIIYGNEGSKPQNNVWRIQFVLSKNKEHMKNLLEFLNQIRGMLAHFGISTSHIQLRKQKGREFCGRFYIKGKENLLKFYDRIGFVYASEKQAALKALLKRGKFIN